MQVSKIVDKEQESVWRVAIEWLIVPVLMAVMKWLAPAVAKAYARHRSIAMSENTKEVRLLRKELESEHAERLADRISVQKLTERVHELSGQVSVLVRLTKESME